MQHESVKRPMLGAHVSISGGVSEAPGRGKLIGCDCVQIFTKSSRQWAAKPLSAEEIAAFKKNCAENGIKGVIAHDSYLINLGAPDEQMRKKSVTGFIDELQRCEALAVGHLPPRVDQQEAAVLVDAAGIELDRIARKRAQPLHRRHQDRADAWAGRATRRHAHGVVGLIS